MRPGDLARIIALIDEVVVQRWGRRAKARGKTGQSVHQTSPHAVEFEFVPDRSLFDTGIEIVISGRHDLNLFI